jgi:hypothetical protein
MKSMTERDRRESDGGSSKGTMTGDLNAKHPFQTSVVSNS